VDDFLKPGPRDHLLTERLAAALAALPADVIKQQPLDAAEGPGRLARHLAAALLPGLTNLGLSDEQAALANAVLASANGDDGDAIVRPPMVLNDVLRDATAAPSVRPATAFAVSDLLVNGEGQPNIGSELRAELATAERVDLICAFVIWSGVIAVRDPLRELIERGGRVRVITTTYMGATQRPAVDELVKIGAEVRVAFDARSTKLHAKSWLMERSSGLTTAFIGSSNLSQTALFDGLEWNVRLSEVDAGHVINRVRTMFATHWEAEHFEHYDPDSRGEDLDRALGLQREPRGSAISFAGLEVHPLGYQQRMLDRLQLERARHNRHRNLVVAATGTGKTVLAALDYRRLCEEHGKDLSLLFVAHRGQILHQTLATFRAVMRQGSFGEIHGDGAIARGRHVFAMVQSLQRERVQELAPDAYDMVVVDEFHHAAATSYDRLLRHLAPLELLGLTATPERLDGQDITTWFGGRIAVELRLWEAIDQGYLVPFQYFGVADNVDLSRLAWKRGGYAPEELSNLYTGNDLRVAKLLQEIERVVADPGRMRALGFCVSVEHARYMARKFTDAGLPAVSVDGTTPEHDRTEHLRQLAACELRVIFSVDVLGEGVDVPVVDTVLLLRPTQSATVFTQQLGRGLRQAPGKPSLTVIDLIGQQHRSFRFDERLAAILDVRRGPVRKQVDEGFPFLPSGCHIELDRVSRDIVLDNLKAVAKLGQWRTLLNDLKSFDPGVTLSRFLQDTGREPLDLYRSADASWTRLRRDAGLPTAPSGDANDEQALLRAVRRALHIDDPERVRFYGALMSQNDPPRSADFDVRHQRLLGMLLWGMWGLGRSFDDLDASLRALWRHPAVLREFRDLLDVLDANSTTLPAPSQLDPAIPLTVHATYAQSEILAAYGLGSPAAPPQVREGVKWMEHSQTDVFFVTLHKAERDYSPTTMYKDYAISRELFHWESQATQSQESPVVGRYIEHLSRGTNVHLFLRDRKTLPHGATSPYVFAGPLRYVSHEGSRPVAFTWKLESLMPEELFEVARSVAA
jgi:superfamily II DNA or RNA helicase/HKD family nuclease